MRWFVGNNGHKRWQNKKLDRSSVFCGSVVWVCEVRFRSESVWSCSVYTWSTCSELLGEWSLTLLGLKLQAHQGQSSWVSVRRPLNKSWHVESAHFTSMKQQNLFFLFFEVESVTQTGVQWRGLGSLQPPLSVLKWFSCFSLQIVWFIFLFYLLVCENSANFINTKDMPELRRIWHFPMQISSDVEFLGWFGFIRHGVDSLPNFCGANNC